MSTALHVPLKAPVVIHYPEGDGMAESLLQHLIIEFLRPLIERYINAVLAGTMSKSKTNAGHKTLRKHKRFCVGSDQLWYYEQNDPKKCVAPDVYVLAGEEQHAERRSVKLWELSGSPLFALEIVGQNKEKDYRDSPEKFALTGVQELVVYDPEVSVLVAATPKRDAATSSSIRYRWQVWRRSVKNAWARVEATNDDRVYSQSLCCWLFVHGAATERKLRIGTGERGEQVFFTEAEAQTHRAETEAQRAETEAQRALRAEGEIAKLRERLRAFEEAAKTSKGGAR